MHKKITLPQIAFKLLREALYYLDIEPEDEFWLVGGTIRDIILGREVFDLDIATSFDPVERAKKFAHKTRSGFVVLDDERRVVRVVKTVNSLHYTIDLAGFRADSIEEDLIERDFTINAIAARLEKPLTSPELTIFDPLNGYEALKANRIEACTDHAFVEDPLRMMRGFRFAALFDAELSESLFTLIQRDSSLLDGVSNERIRDEFFKILGVSNSHKWIEMLQKAGVLKYFLPELNRCMGVEQNEWHHLDVFHHSLYALKNLEELLIKGFDFPWWPKFKNFLNEHISGSRTYLEAFKLGCLLHDLGKPTTKREEKKKVIFHGHEMEGVRLIRKIADRMRLSSAESSFLQLVVKNHMRPGVMVQQGINDRRLFKFYTETGREGVAISLLSLADRLSAMGTLSEKDLKEFEAGILEIMQAFYTQMEKPQAPTLISGKDLIGLGLKPGPKFKEILAAVKEAQFLGELNSREEAVEFAQKRI